MYAEVENIDHVVMPHLRRDPPFAQKTCPSDLRFRGLGGERVENLDRDAAAERLVLRLVDDPHASTADDSNEFVVAQPGARAKGEH